MDDFGGFIPNPALARAPGIYPDVPNEDYHTGPGISASGLKTIGRSPLRYRYPGDNSSVSKRKGTALHMAALEPDLFERTYVCEYQPGEGDLVNVDDIKDRLRKQGLPLGGKKEDLIARLLEVEPDAPIADVFKSRHEEGRIALPKDGPQGYDLIMRMRDSLYMDPFARELLTAPGRVEHSAYWVDPVTGVLCRCRPDKALTDGAGILLDLKSVADASEDGFGKAAGNFWYWLQHPFYQDGWPQAGGEAIDTFLFVCVENDIPAADPGFVAVHELHRKDVEFGRSAYQHLLALYAECLASDTWPGHPGGVCTPNIPPYCFRGHQW